MSEAKMDTLKRGVERIREEHALNAFVAATNTHAVFASLIAGAVYDFAGYLTTREEGTIFGARHPAVPMVELLTAWAKARGLPLDEAAVLSWSDALAAQKKEEPK